MHLNTPQHIFERKFKRRVFLKYAAVGGTTVAFGDALLTSAPWLDYDKQARQTWDTPFQSQRNPPALMRELIRYATLAPSGHNAQPWKFAIEGNTIRILPDYRHCLPAVDPQNRELWISLGCALENVVIAANATGYEAQVTYPTPGADFIAVNLTRVLAHDTALFEAIPHRQSTRSLYDGRAISLSQRKQLEAVHSDSSVSFRVITDAVPKEAIIEIIKASNQHQYSDPLFVNELISSLRFNKPEALHTLDGLYSLCSGNPSVPRWIGERFVTAGGAKKQSASDEERVRSSSGLILIAAAQDDKRHWIETGRLNERLVLTLTALNIKTAYLNQPIEVVGLRSQLGSYLNLGKACPQLLLRFGYAAPMPRSLRRPLEEVMI